MDKGGIALRGALPLAGVEAAPVAVVSAGDTVNADVQQSDFLARRLRPVNGGNIARPNGTSAVGEGDAREHISRSRPLSSLAYAKSPSV